jgi:lysozyme
MYTRHFAFITLAILGIIAVGDPLNNYTLKGLEPTAKSADDEVKPIWGIPLPVGFRVHGLDISHYQEKVNWATLCSSKTDSTGLSFVFIRSTMGSDRTDNTFKENWRAAKKAGLVRAPYHYFDPRQNATLQARNYLRNTRIEPGDLPPVLDIEVKRLRRKKDVVAFQNAVSVWLKLVEKATGSRPIIYSAYTFYHDYLATKFSNYPVWIAYYNPATTPELNPAQQWHFWQHSDKGKVNGIKGFVDLNVFNGSMKDLQCLCIQPPKKAKSIVKQAKYLLPNDVKVRTTGVNE